MAADSGIDPRYAAQFQRGFDPALHPAPRSSQRAAAPERIEAPAAFVPQIVVPPRMATTPVQPPADAQHASEVAADEPLATPLLRRRWLLPAFAAALLAGAIALFAMSIDTGMYGQAWSQADYVWNNFRLLLPGPLLVASVVTMTVWIVARATDDRLAP